MMDFLIGDVRKDRFPRGLAHGKSTIPGLPAEIGVAFAFYNLSRTGFEILYQFGKRNLSGEATKNVDMICYSADQ
jgi:hypothetical protein